MFRSGEEWFQKKSQSLLYEVWFPIVVATLITMEIAKSQSLLYEVWFPIKWLREVAFPDVSRNPFFMRSGFLFPMLTAIGDYIKVAIPSL